MNSKFKFTHTRACAITLLLTLDLVSTCNLFTIMAADYDLELLPLEGAKRTYFGFPVKDGHYIEKDKKKRDTVYCKMH